MAKRKHQVGHDGPRDLTEVLRVLPSCVEAVLREDANACEEMRNVVTRGVVLTSCYSGTGAFESVAVQVLESAAAELGISGPCIACHSACDVSSLARRALQHHRKESGTSVALSACNKFLKRSD